MENEIRPGGPGRRGRISRPAAGHGEATHKLGQGEALLRVAGVEAVDTIPLLQEKDFEDGESKALDRLLEGQFTESFSNEGFADDLAGAHAFVKEIVARGAGAPGLEGLLGECERILKDEVAKARHMDFIRKGVQKA